MPPPNDTNVFQNWKDIADGIIDDFKKIIDAEDTHEQVRRPLQDATEVLRIAQSSAHPPPSPSTRSMEEVLELDWFPRVFQLTEELTAWNVADSKLDTIPNVGVNPRSLLGREKAEHEYELHPKKQLSWIKFWESATGKTRELCSYIDCTEKADTGGHIWLEGRSRNKYCYIAPICRGCNNAQKRSRAATPQSKLKKIMVVRIRLSDDMRKASIFKEFADMNLDS